MPSLLPSEKTQSCTPQGFLKAALHTFSIKAYILLCGRQSPWRSICETPLSCLLSHLCWVTQSGGRICCLMQPTPWCLSRLSIPQSLGPWPAFSKDPPLPTPESPLAMSHPWAPSLCSLALNPPRLGHMSWTCSLHPLHCLDLRLPHHLHKDHNNFFLIIFPHQIPCF